MDSGHFVPEIGLTCKKIARHLIAAQFVATYFLGYGAERRTRMEPYHSGGILVEKVPAPPQPKLETIVLPLSRLVTYSS